MPKKIKIAVVQAPRQGWQPSNSSFMKALKTYGVTDVVFLPFNSAGDAFGNNLIDEGILAQVAHTYPKQAGLKYEFIVVGSLPATRALENAMAGANPARLVSAGEEDNDPEPPVTFGKDTNWEHLNDIPKDRKPVVDQSSDSDSDDGSGSDTDNDSEAPVQSALWQHTSAFLLYQFQQRSDVNFRFLSYTGQNLVATKIKHSRSTPVALDAAAPDSSTDDDDPRTPVHKSASYYKRILMGASTAHWQWRRFKKWLGNKVQRNPKVTAMVAGAMAAAVIFGLFAAGMVFWPAYTALFLGFFALGPLGTAALIGSSTAWLSAGLVALALGSVVQQVTYLLTWYKHKYLKENHWKKSALQKLHEVKGTHKMAIAITTILLLATLVALPLLEALLPGAGLTVLLTKLAIQAHPLLVSMFHAAVILAQGLIFTVALTVSWKVVAHRKQKAVGKTMHAGFGEWDDDADLYADVDDMADYRFQGPGTLPEGVVRRHQGNMLERLSFQPASTGDGDASSARSSSLAPQGGSSALTTPRRPVMSSAAAPSPIPGSSAFVNALYEEGSDEEEYYFDPDAQPKQPQAHIASFMDVAMPGRSYSSSDDDVVDGDAPLSFADDSFGGDLWSDDLTSSAPAFGRPKEAGVDLQALASSDSPDGVLAKRVLEEMARMRGESPADAPPASASAIATMG